MYKCISGLDLYGPGMWVSSGCFCLGFSYSLGLGIGSGSKPGKRLNEASCLRIGLVREIETL